MGYQSSPLQIGKRFARDWKNVACSNEKQNENIDPSCLVTTVQAAGGGVMVWGIFSWHTLGPLLPIGHGLMGIV